MCIDEYDEKNPCTHTQLIDSTGTKVQWPLVSNKLIEGVRLYHKAPPHGLHLTESNAELNRCMADAFAGDVAGALVAKIRVCV